MAWYFDHVLASNRGTSEPFYFFLKPTFWFSSCLRKYRTQKSTISKHRKSSFTSIDISSTHHKSPISTAYEEKRLIKMMESEKQPCEGVRIMGLSKTYRPISIFNDLMCCKKALKVSQHHKNRKKSNAGGVNTETVQPGVDHEVSSGVHALDNVYLEI